MPGLDGPEGAVAEVDLDLRPGVETQGPRSDLGPERVQLVAREDAAAAGLPPCDAFELAQLLERVDPDVRVGADTDRDTSCADALGGEEAVAEVRLRRRAGADRRAVRRHE